MMVTLTCGEMEWKCRKIIGKCRGVEKARSRLVELCERPLEKLNVWRIGGDPRIDVGFWTDQNEAKAVASRRGLEETRHCEILVIAEN